MNTIIIEDEQQSAESLKSMLTDYCPEIKLSGIYYTISDGLKVLSQNKTELVFLDVMLRDGTGFDLLSHFTRHYFRVVFTAAYDQYALKAIKFSAVDYLLKPINVKELREAVKKAKEVIPRSHDNGYINHLTPIADEKEKLRQIALPTLHGYNFVEIKNIIRFEADGSYTKVFLLNDEMDQILLSHNLKFFEELLQSERFFRAHHSHLINLNQIKKYMKGTGGYVVMKDGSTVNIASRRREDLLMALEIH